MTITESSTIMPSTKISAARVTVFSSMPVIYISPMQIAMHTGTPVQATRAVRNGKSRSITAMTTRIEISISRRNERTESSTTFGWSVTRCRRMSGGNCSEASSSTFCTVSPNATILLPGSISMLMSSELGTLYRLASLPEL